MTSAELAVLERIAVALERLADARESSNDPPKRRPGGRADLSPKGLHSLAQAIRGKVGGGVDFLASELVQGVDTVVDMALVAALSRCAPGSDAADVARRLGNALSEAQHYRDLGGGIRVERVGPTRAGVLWRVIPP